METLEGKRPVLEALRAGRPVNKILVAAGANPRVLQEILGLAREQGIPVQQVDRKKIDQVATTASHQGIIALTAAKAYAEVDDLFAAAAVKGEDPLLVLLDDLEDPHNLGAILRTADATGVHGVIIPRRHGVPLTAAVAKASAGAVEYVPVARVSNLAQTIARLKEKGCWIAGADMEAPEEYHRRDLTGPLVLVVGGEGRGLSRLVQESCDFLVSIPMRGQLNSLNAAVAASILLFEVVRQRTGRGATSGSR